MNDSSICGFPLSRQQQDTARGIAYTLWFKTHRAAEVVCIDQQEAVFFIYQADISIIQQLLKNYSDWSIRALKLQSVASKEVAGLYCQSLRTYYQVIEKLRQARIPMMEEDIRPVDRFMMERHIFAGGCLQQKATRTRWVSTDFIPVFTRLSLDIETTMSADKILSIAMTTDHQEQVIFLGPDLGQPNIISCSSEKQMLLVFQMCLKKLDPDLILGWNVIGFDLLVLQKRAAHWGLSLKIGRDDQPLRIGQTQAGRYYAYISGRVVLDGIDTLKGATWHFERYSLEFVAHQLLGKGKLIEHTENRGVEIQRLYAADPQALIAYNLEDCRLVMQIFDKTELIAYLIERARLTGLPLDKVGGSAQAFDNMYLPKLHRQGFVAPEFASGQTGAPVPGGHVMDSIPGLYKNVLVLDFKSLYPSIIRTFYIDPLGLHQAEIKEEQDAVEGYLGANFSRSTTLLPDIIARLGMAREQAKLAGNGPMSQAIKIQMNACYGVLGSTVCRFYDQRLSASITFRGHDILKKTAAFIETTFKYQVIYGDTDSVFVWVGDDLTMQETDRCGHLLAETINKWWSVSLHENGSLQSFLELQYETCFKCFLMPTIRDSERGSKKRYAGLKWQAHQEDALIFRGLENVRSDWTWFARHFQEKLYRLIFTQQPHSDYIKEVVADLLNGQYDEQLVYHRRLRKPVAHYTKQIPQHVRAAMQLNQSYQARGIKEHVKQGDTVAFVITVNGAEALELSGSALDYNHYIEKQLKPVADSILPLVGEQFDHFISAQLTLF